MAYKVGGKYPLGPVRFLSWLNEMRETLANVGEDMTASESQTLATELMLSCRALDAIASRIERRRKLLAAARLTVVDLAQWQAEKAEILRGDAGPEAGDDGQLSLFRVAL